MNGKIIMNFKDVDEKTVDTNVEVNVNDVGFADKCIALESLAAGLKMDRFEFFMATQSVMSHMGEDKDGGTKDEG